MKRILKILLTLLAALVVLAVAAYACLGGFSSVTIEEQQMGPFTILYKDMVGADMSQVGTITHEIEEALRGAGFVSHKPFDIFYPDGHAEIGFVVAVNEAPTDGLVEKLSMFESKYKIKFIPAGAFMTTTFPWKMVLSYMVGFMKVDPALEAHRKKNGYRKTWAATRHDGESITYLQPIVKELIAPQ